MERLHKSVCFTYLKSTILTTVLASHHRSTVSGWRLTGCHPETARHAPDTSWPLQEHRLISVLSSSSHSHRAFRWCRLLAGGHAVCLRRRRGDKEPGLLHPRIITPAQTAGRVAHTWGFDNGANAAPGRTFLLHSMPKQVRTLTDLAASTTRQVQEVAGKRPERPLHFDPSVEQELLWLAVSGSSTSICSGNVLQFNPSRLFQRRRPADSAHVP